MEDAVFISIDGAKTAAQRVAFIKPEARVMRYVQRGQLVGWKVRYRDTDGTWSTVTDRQVHIFGLDSKSNK